MQNNTNTNTLLITAKTLLKKDFDFAPERVHPIVFEILFHLDSKKFKRIHVFKQGSCNVTPWILLDLLDQTIPQEYFGEADKIKYVYHSSIRAAYPALKIQETSKLYRLDHEVKISWLRNEDILDLLAFWHINRKLFQEEFDMPNQKWHFWIEELCLENPEFN